jgi:hypothetical protein
MDIDISLPTSDRVKKYLVAYPHLRDDDNKLIAKIWKDEAKVHGMGAVNYTANFLALVHDGKLTNTETIRRARQMIQAKYPNLRGNAYQKRHEKKEDVSEEVLRLKRVI